MYKKKVMQVQSCCFAKYSTYSLFDVLVVVDVVTVLKSLAGLILQSNLHVKPSLVSGDCDQILASDNFTVFNCF